MKYELKLTKKEYEAIRGLESYYCSLDVRYPDIDYKKEEIAALEDEELIRNGLSKLLKIYWKVIEE